MGDTIQFPTDVMRTKAQNIFSDNTMLTDIIHTHIQQMQQHHDSLPTSMQAPFRDFVSTMQQHLSNGTDLHQHIGILLQQAAEAAEGTDANNSKGFEPPKP
jgi:uncharacterized protein YukE